MNLKPARNGHAASRLLSLDVLRGFTVAGMVLVTDPGTYEHVYPQLSHARWNDPTAADLIFPCFLVMTGISMTLSFTARLGRGETRGALAWHALRRSLWLIGLGLLVNGFPGYDLHHLRIPGILQRIGVCYFPAALLYLALQRPAALSNVPPGGARRIRGVILALVCTLVLGVYWALLKLYPTPGFEPGRLDPLGCLPAVLDRAVFTVPHMFRWGVQTPGFGITFDPEGILSTLGAFGSVLIGVLAGETLRGGTDHRRRQCGVLAMAGSLLWLLSLVLRGAMPLNKQIYTPTFTLWSSGLSLLAFAALFLLIDIRGVRRGWTLPLIYGTNAILAFFLSQVLTTFLSRIHVATATGDRPLYWALDGWLFAPWLPGRLASLAYAVVIVLLCAAVVYPLYRRRIFLRL